MLAENLVNTAKYRSENSEKRFKKGLNSLIKKELLEVYSKLAGFHMWGHVGVTVASLGPLEAVLWHGQWQNVPQESLKAPVSYKSHKKQSERSALQE